MNKKNNEFEKNFITNNHFFCISHFNGQLDWISEINQKNYIVYNKSGSKLSKKINHINIDNVGYNLTSYLKFIIDNYSNLPEIIVFCKDNVFRRHVKYEQFKKLLKRKAFTCIETDLINYKFPINLKTADYGYVEINSSWYKNKYPRLFFKDFNSFYKYIFKNVESPNFIRFAPGANYIVPKSNILLRNLNFYKNLLIFISHSQFSCESHFLERSLYAIWNSNLESSYIMDKELNKNEIESLKYKCLKSIKKENIFLKKTYQKIIFTLGYLYMNFFMKNAIK